MCAVSACHGGHNKGMYRFFINSFSSSHVHVCLTEDITVMYIYIYAISHVDMS